MKPVCVWALENLWILQTGGASSATDQETFVMSLLCLEKYPGQKVVRMKQGLTLWFTFCLILFLASCQTAPSAPTPENAEDLEPTLTTVRWSSPATWGGSVPKAGQNVEIPKGKAILLDVSPPALGNLTINGTLVFDNKDLNLTARWIMVHGRFEIGVPSALYTKKAVITLTGPDEDVMGMGGKVLGVMGGLLTIHGERKATLCKASSQC